MLSEAFYGYFTDKMDLDPGEFGLEVLDLRLKGKLTDEGFAQIRSVFSQIDFGPGSFSAFIYFGFVTLTTLGYGDITPALPLARSLATFTTLVGQLYLVIIMAFIIGKFLNTKGTDQKLE